MLASLALTGILAAATQDGPRPEVPTRPVAPLTEHCFPELNGFGNLAGENPVRVHVFQAVPGQAFVLQGLPFEWIEAAELLADGKPLRLGYNTQGQVIVDVPAHLAPDEAIIVIKLRLVV